MTKAINKVLVIKLGGVGEMVLAFPAFERIRAAHPKARITLLTTEPFLALAQSSPFFNAVEADGRPLTPGGWANLVMRLRAVGYDRVYDLQNDQTTNLIFQALRPMAPQWSGTAMGAALPHRNRDRARMHQLERQAQQLEDAGIWPDAPTRPLSAPPPDISWVLARSAQPRSISVASGHRAMVVLAPGGAGQPATTRWSGDNYAELARRLQEGGYDVVIVGALGESELAHAIQRQAPRARDLTGRTDLMQVAGLGARAALAIGNDIGVLHLAAAAGAPTIALLLSQPDPALVAPRGHVTVLHAPELKQLSLDTVARTALALAQPTS